MRDEWMISMLDIINGIKIIFGGYVRVRECCIPELLVGPTPF